MPELPVEESPLDSKYDKWVDHLRMWIGPFVAGALLIIWVEARFVKRSEFEGHETTQKELVKHDLEDKQTYATKVDVQELRAEFLDHRGQIGHPQTIEINRIQNSRITHIEANQAWMVNAIWLMSKKVGVQVPPPPLPNVKNGYNPEE